MLGQLLGVIGPATAAQDKTFIFEQELEAADLAIRSGRYPRLDLVNVTVPQTGTELFANRCVHNVTSFGVPPRWDIEPLAPLRAAREGMTWRVTVK
jgi:hypothetical protein